MKNEEQDPLSGGYLVFNLGRLIETILRDGLIEPIKEITDDYSALTKEPAMRATYEYLTSTRNIFLGVAVEYYQALLEKLHNGLGPEDDLQVKAAYSVLTYPQALTGNRQVRKRRLELIKKLLPVRNKVSHNHITR